MATPEESRRAVAVMGVGEGADRIHGEVQRLALDTTSGAELLKLIRKLRDELYTEIGEGCTAESLARALEISRRLDAAIVSLMKIGSDRS